MRRVVLFLEGPASPFLRRVADLIGIRGHEARAIVFCAGDMIFWRVLVGRGADRHAPAPPFDFWRGDLGDWPVFLDRYLVRHGVTDVVMLGDGRPVHAAAVEVAMARNVRIHILEHGYVRPDWLTLEPDGMSGRSRMPRDPEIILRMAEGLPAVDLTPRWRSSFLRYSLWDLAYHLPNVFLGPFLHPRYRTHGPVHPLVEYGGWIFKWLKAPLERRHLARTLPPFLEGRRRYFLFPLQLPGDYQIRNYAPGGNLMALVEETLRSFAASAPRDRHLLFKVHPLDNGLGDWHRRIGRIASALGIGDRVATIDGGPLDPLLGRAEGVVLVNSTVGTAAIAAGRPVFVLGEAVYAVPGLVTRDDLDGFWSDPVPPDGRLADAFLRLLVARIQVRGGFVDGEAMAVGARGVAERILADEEAFPVSMRRRTVPRRGASTTSQDERRPAMENRRAVEPVCGDVFVTHRESDKPRRDLARFPARHAPTRATPSVSYCKIRLETVP